ncbi:MAG: T9SS type A sorting domain-containing protein [Bacteroidia bacterium]|nr:T9SS type A sorting domain-containing protein [Bacteroidia bacterium]
MLLRSTIFILIGLLFVPSDLPAQVVTFFADSPDSEYYDTGLAFLSGSSTFTRTGPSGDKIPVTANSYRGKNALSFTWNSKPGGNWDALVIAPGFPFLDITQSDSLSFWVYSATGLSKSRLPKISMEGAPGATKTLKYSLKTLTDDIPAAQWHRISIPLTVFTNDPAQTNIQFTQIKAIIFSQDSADQTDHTLLVDEVKTVPASSGSPVIPTGFSGKGYERHGEFHWNLISANNLDGYHLYFSEDNGQSFQFAKYISQNDSMTMDFWGDPGSGISRLYHLRSVGFGGDESAPSASVSVSGNIMTDDEFLDMVQEATFRYFWDFAHPVSGLARERNSSGNTVTIGGSGFGVMAIVAGIERGYITREEGLARLLKITEFLQNADRFHGAWSHWLNGNTGNVIPFSAQDDGGDLVETAFMVQGLLSVRQYFDQATPNETLLRDRITTLWNGVEWNWYRRLTQQVMYWHWSPNFAWAMNFALRGFNEAHIVYLLGIASNTHAVPASLYPNGWAGSNYTNGQTYYGYKLDVGPGNGGPLFFSHYSYLGFDPRGIRDAYTNYFVRNAHQTLINRAWCIANPKNHAGYGEDCWGLTASDDPLVGYLAHEPSLSRDNGTIAPTAAISSMPYTPKESIAALKHFYREHGEELWGPMGFYDAFNVSENWVADSYLAIDQGPIIVMIENYRSGLFWELFMSNPEIQPALDAIGFAADSTAITGIASDIEKTRWAVSPNPVSEGALTIQSSASFRELQVCLFTGEGRMIFEETTQQNQVGESKVNLPPLPAGIYYLRILQDGQTLHSQPVVFTR